jgi:LacI family transcriptional regulator
MERPIATIKDVAREAGVSISTVSSVINGTKPVSEHLARRVREAVDKLEFYPNHMARSLHAKQTKTLAYLTPDVTNVAFLRVFRAIETVARARGYTVFLIETGGSVEMTRQAVERVIGLKMDGAYLTLNWAMAQPDANLHHLAERGIAMVGVSGSYERTDCDCFLHDEDGAGRQIGDYLQRIGHREVVLVGPSSSRGAEKRWGGLTASYGESAAGAATKIVVAATEGYASRAGYDAVRAEIARRTPFTAMVAFNDAIATGALAALSDHALTIPDRVSFVSFGDGHRDFSRPQITSMTFDEEKIAELAGNRLIDRIEGLVTEAPAQALLPLTLSIRASSRRVP